jgi:hypothetical protein
LLGRGVFGTLVEPTDALSISVAIKADGAIVNTSLWNVGRDSPRAAQACQVIQWLLHHIWYKNLEKEAFAWLSEGDQVGSSDCEWAEDLEAILNCLQWVRGSTWFEWKDGSHLFFWRWPLDLCKEARDGTPVLHCKIPAWCFIACTAMDIELWMSALVNEKLQKFFWHHYVIPRPQREIHVPIVYFSVKKGDNDIWMVWSETEQGITETVFALQIFYPTLGTLLRRLPNNAYIGDFDIGEQFHNFCLPKPEWTCHRIFLPKDLWEEIGCDAGVWAHLPMGL